MKKDLRVAAIQGKVTNSKEEGEKQVIQFVREAINNSIDMIGLPEDCLSSSKETRKGYDAFAFLSQVAKDNRIYLFGANTTLGKDGKVYNTGFLFDRDGNLLGAHNKIVLTPPEEELGITAGNALKVIDSEFGKIGLLVCKDAFHRYAAWFFEELRRSEVEIVLIPSFSLNVSKRSTDLWIDSLKALAKWFDMYIVAPGTIGENPTSYDSFGHALIICPKRGVLAEGSVDKEEILYAILDVKSIDEIRNSYGAKWQPSSIPQIKLSK